MPEFCIIDKKSITELLRAIEADVLAPGRTAVGILVDADEYPTRRWQAVADRLRRAGITAPSVPDPTGTIIDGNPCVGVWMMPDNKSSGELEYLVAGMIPAGDVVWPLSEAYIASIPSEARKFTEGKILRAKVHAWLATREEPRKMGAAIGARDLNAGAPAAVQLVDWLRRLFG